MKYVTKTIVLSLFATVFSCSHQHETSRLQSSPPIYSDDVEKEFSLIEMEQQQALEYYRKLRRQNWSEYKKGTEGKYRQVVPKRYRQRQSQPKPSPQARPVVMTEEQIKELEIEIGQNLAYFCMQKRKDRRFSDEADCQAFTQNALNDCEQSVGGQHDRRVLTCLKGKLR